MSVEGRGWVTRVGIDLVNWKQEEPAGLGRRRQPSGGGTSRMSREAQVRICERLGVRFPGPTRRRVVFRVYAAGDSPISLDPERDRVPGFASRANGDKRQVNVHPPVIQIHGIQIAQGKRSGR
jgi:hypothetical protein